MTNIRSPNEIIISILEFFRTAQPLLDTKPGTVARDLAVDSLATQIARLYEELAGISNLQSLRLSSGSDLDRIAQNFGAVRQRGSRASGPILLTFSSLNADIALNQGERVVANNGVSFELLNSQTVSPVFETAYRATAAKYRSDLDFVGITDDFAVEVLVEATTTGIGGNVSKYTITKTNIPNINNVTNVFPLSGGRETEDDATFRNRIFSIFSGANTGTALGYRNAALADASVIDVIVVEPGSPLMTRDGTQVVIAEDGTRTIISDGTGGKVDIYILGTRLQEVVDSYIFRDLSNTGDVTNSENNFILGQISGDENKTVARRRLENLAAGVLPNQPVNNILQITGSLSGSNFVEKQVDSLGRVTGNYEIVKDTGAFAGSPFGFDAIGWISGRISDYQESKTKQDFNSQDPLAFTDVTEISGATQNISVINENSSITPSDRSSIQLSHFPITNVTRVFNVTTGERYVIRNQNPDGDGANNETGRIVISGQTLPAISDTLQVDYTWVFSYDPNFDFDNKTTATNPRAVGDSIDWGFSNAVRRERSTLIAAGSLLTVTVTHEISSVINVNVFVEETGNLVLTSGRVAFIASSDVTSVVSVVRDSDGTELWNTSDADGSFSGQTIFLPTDTLGTFGETVTVVYNAVDLFSVDTQGNFDGNVITISPSAVAVAGTIVEVSYISNISTLLPSTTLAELPAIRNGNGFDTNTSTGIGTQPTTHVYDVGGTTILSNLRQAPSVIGLNVTGSISPGVLTVSGVTITGVFDAVFSASQNGLQQDFSSAVKTALGLSSNQSVPSSIRIGRISKLERVLTTSGNEVLEVLDTYDLRGYKLLDNNFVKEESVQDASLTSTQFELPATPDNISNQPSVGDSLRATFYIVDYDDSENISFSRSGLLYTNKVFAFVDSVAISSGFLSTVSASATLSLLNLNQPGARTRYRALYDYTAPKVNERITIRYNYDRLITDVTFAVENTRPISADVLVKAATSIPVDVEMSVVVTDAFINNTETVRQNIQDAVTAALNTQTLGSIIDSSDLVNVAYSVDGVDRVRVLFFNKSDQAGSVLSIEAQDNEYIVASTVTINIESR
jgi:uncharacterized phage protein gp47/JayE